MAKKISSDDEDYPIGYDEGENIPAGTDEIDSEEAIEKEAIKEKLYQEYMANRLAVVEDQSTMPVPHREDDYSIGGISGDMGMYDPSHRQLPSQIQMRYLLHPDDVPSTVNKKLWGIVTRHLELINIADERDLPRYFRQIRNIIRVATWDHDMKNVPFADIEEVEFYAGKVLLMKSIRHAERQALMTTINRQQVEEFGERAPGGYGGGPPPGSGGGFIGAIRSFFGGRR